MIDSDILTDQLTDSPTDWSVDRLSNSLNSDILCYFPWFLSLLEASVSGNNFWPTQSYRGRTINSVITMHFGNVSRIGGVTRWRSEQTSSTSWHYKNRYERSLEKRYRCPPVFQKPTSFEVYEDTIREEYFIPRGTNEPIILDANPAICTTWYKILLSDCVYHSASLYHFRKQITLSLKSFMFWKL